MAKKDRKGNRKDRNQRLNTRAPEMGYYIIYTDTEATEKCYFDGLRDSIPEDMKRKLIIKVQKSKTRELVSDCLDELSMDAQYRIPWIVFDRDQVHDFDKIITEAEKNHINAGWSNPCFEIWMFAYYGGIPNIEQSWVCCKKFAETFKKHTGLDYSKSEDDLYQLLVKSGDERKAIEMAKKTFDQHIKDEKSKPSEMTPCTTVYQLVEEIRSKIPE